jgi:hypothetical protein
MPNSVGNIEPAQMDKFRAQLGHGAYVDNQPCLDRRSQANLVLFHATSPTHSQVPILRRGAVPQRITLEPDVLTASQPLYFPRRDMVREQHLAIGAETAGAWTGSSSLVAIPGTLP